MWRAGNPARHAPRDDGRLVELGLLVEQSAFDAGQGAGDYQRIGRAVTRILGKHRHDELTQLEIHGIRQRRHCVVDVRRGDIDRRGTGEWAMPGDSLVGDDAQRVDVGLR